MLPVCVWMVSKVEISSLRQRVLVIVPLGLLNFRNFHFRETPLRDRISLSHINPIDLVFPDSLLATFNWLFPMGFKVTRGGSSLPLFLGWVRTKTPNAQTKTPNAQPKTLNALGFSLVLIKTNMYISKNYQLSQLLYLSRVYRMLSFDMKEPVSCSNQWTGTIAQV